MPTLLLAQPAQSGLAVIPATTHFTIMASPTVMQYATDFLKH